MSTKVGIGVVGLGHWGSALARSFAQLPSADLRWVCDTDRRVLERASLGWRNARETTNLRRVLDDPKVGGVVIATPLATHAELVRCALEAGKHVLVQQPLAFSADEARELLELATSTGRMLLAGHVILFHPAMRMLKQSIDLGQLGELHYLYGSHKTLESARRDGNVLWTLGAHDIAAVLYLLDNEPLSVSARGASYVTSGRTDVAFCYLRFAGGVNASLQLSWLEAETERRLTVVGSQQMAAFDDLNTTRPLTVYDKGPLRPRSARHGVRFSPGAIASPTLPTVEPLMQECESFLSAIRHGRDPGERALLGVRVVAVLEALERSLERGGVEEPIGLPAEAANVIHFRARS